MGVQCHARFLFFRAMAAMAASLKDGPDVADKIHRRGGRDGINQRKGGDETRSDHEMRQRENNETRQRVLAAAVPSASRCFNGAWDFPIPSPSHGSGRARA